MRHVVAILGISLVMGFAAHAGLPRSHPKVDDKIYVKAPVDKRQVTVKEPISKPLYDTPRFQRAQNDPHTKTVKKTAPTRFEKASRKNRKRSHFTEWP